jgi:hypothetical protein
MLHIFAGSGGARTPGYFLRPRWGPGSLNPHLLAHVYRIDIDGHGDVVGPLPSDQEVG